MRGPEKNKNERGEAVKKKGVLKKGTFLVDKSEANTLYTVSRLEYIRLKLQRGDKKRIAEKLDVHPEWVSQVIRGKGISEPVLQEAERIIRERK